MTWDTGSRDPSGTTISRVLGRWLPRSVPRLVDEPDEDAVRSEPAVRRGLGLSAKLLLLTAIFVMLAEVLIFVPSIANYRVNWLTERLTAARLASLAADAAPDHGIPLELQQELLSTAKVSMVAIKSHNKRRLVLAPDHMPAVGKTVNLLEMHSTRLWPLVMERLTLIADALEVFVAPAGRTLLVTGHPYSPPESSLSMEEFVEILMQEAPLRTAMINHALNILGLSIIISVIAAALVYFALNRLLVQPVMRLSRSMLSFRNAPENASAIIVPSRRRDEVGVAERELARMQEELRSLLRQKNHLAQLGLAVSKINHDLRNMLASSQLLSDRLATIKDPAVQSFAPKLIASLDRAISFCNDTLRYGRTEEAAPRRTVFRLADLVEEVGEGLGLPRAGLHWQIAMEPGLSIDADRDHLFRVLNNLARNAVQVLEQQPAGSMCEIVVTARREGRRVVCNITDNGPGVPAKARENLFRAFQGSARKGGTGLGLAIASELIAAHGGRLELVESERGANFRFDIPDR